MIGHLSRLFSALLTAAMSCLLLITTAGAVETNEIKVLYAFSLHPALKDLLPAFEKASEHKISGAYDTAGAVAERVRSGEASDVVIVTRAQSEELEKQGRIVVGSRVDFAKIGVGIYVAKGALKPDVSSVEALKQSLMAAKSIAYLDPASGAASGIYVEGLMDRLGMTAEMAPKVRRYYPAAAIFSAVAQGEAELAFGQISEILGRGLRGIAAGFDPELHTIYRRRRRRHQPSEYSEGADLLPLNPRTQQRY